VRDAVANLRGNHLHISTQFVFGGLDRARNGDLGAGDQQDHNGSDRLFTATACRRAGDIGHYQWWSAIWKAFSVLIGVATIVAGRQRCRGDRSLERESFVLATPNSRRARRLATGLLTH
jgi:hypothetical protein